jgi:hypothetical protein
MNLGIRKAEFHEAPASKEWDSRSWSFRGCNRLSEFGVRHLIRAS